MSTLATARFPRLDGIAIGLSGLCAVHCVATAVAVALLSSAANLLASPIFHEVGLAIAMVLGAVALVLGARQHGMLLPVAVGALGLGIMAGTLTLEHGTTEMIWSLIGVGLLAFGHDLNRRAFW